MPQSCIYHNDVRELCAAGQICQLETHLHPAARLETVAGERPFQSSSRPEFASGAQFFCRLLKYTTQAQGMCRASLRCIYYGTQTREVAISASADLLFRPQHWQHRCSAAHCTGHLRGASLVCRTFLRLGNVDLSPWSATYLHTAQKKEIG